jgi:bifunctional non-homologous end joining protein LigD
MPTETVTLFFKEGSSDKVYTASIEETPSGCLVTFAYGRRGSALTTGTKTATPVPYAKAKQLFDTLVRGKTSKGYTPADRNAPSFDAAREQRDTGLRPQLLNPIEEHEAISLLSDSAYWVQEKHDGRRSFVMKQGTDIIATNRMGLSVGLMDNVLRAAQSIAPDFTIDGELVGDGLRAFDLVSLDGHSLTHLGYAARLELLHLTCSPSPPGIIVIPTAKTTEDKQALYAQLRATHAEGIVFKKHDAPYTPGRPNRGGDQVKFKFTATCSAIVTTGRTGKRSIALELFDGHQARHIGNVTVPANQDIPHPGQIVEIRYLYAYPNGALFQPVLLGVRDDIERKACTIDQLIFKTPIENTDDEL